MLDRLYAHWVYGGFLAGLLLILLCPLITHGWPPVLVISFLLLPASMIHQYEEHDADRFRLFVNQHIGHGKEALSLRAVFFINILGVWIFISACLYLAWAVNVGYALGAVYLMLINGVSHIGQGIAMKGYNPGLVTSCVIFLPLGGYAMVLIQQAGGGALGYQALGFAAAAAVHLAILVHVKRALGAQG